MPKFEVYDRKSKPVAKEPLVTFQARGSFGINEAAWEALGCPSEVEILYDPEERIVGFRQAEEASPHGYPVHKQTNGRTYHFGGVGFTKYYGIETGRSRRFAMRDFDGVYGIDLKEEPVSTRKAKEGKNGRPGGSPEPGRAALLDPRFKAAK